MVSLSQHSFHTAGVLLLNSDSTWEVQGFLLQVVYDISDCSRMALCNYVVWTWWKWHCKSLVWIWKNVVLVFASGKPWCPEWVHPQDGCPPMFQYEQRSKRKDGEWNSGVPHSTGSGKCITPVDRAHKMSSTSSSFFIPVCFQQPPLCQVRQVLVMCV